MLTTPPPQFRKNRGRSKRTAPTTPTGPLALVSAVYEHPAGLLTLQFNQPIDISGIAPGVFIVHDGEFEGADFAGDNPVDLISPTTVRITLVAFTDDGSPGVNLNVDAANGILTVVGGEPWAGVTDLELPYP